MEIVVIDNGFVLCFSSAHGPTFSCRKSKRRKEKKVPEICAVGRCPMYWLAFRVLENCYPIEEIPWDFSTCV